ncbi:MAG: hypothetical protein AAGJ40_12640 [Planctomycetota bacterium]
MSRLVGTVAWLAKSVQGDFSDDPESPTADVGGEETNQPTDVKRRTHSRHVPETC